VVGAKARVWPLGKYAYRSSIRGETGEIFQPEVASRYANKVVGHFLLALLYTVLAITLADFHPHWHLIRPPPGTVFTPPEPPILHPITRQRRRDQETERRAHRRANERIQVA
jgi:hypothetical protein